MSPASTIFSVFLLRKCLHLVAGSRTGSGRRASSEEEPDLVEGASPEPRRTGRRRERRSLRRATPPVGISGGRPLLRSGRFFALGGGGGSRTGFGRRPIREEKPDLVEPLSRTNGAPWDFLRSDRGYGDGRWVGQASARSPAPCPDKLRSLGFPRIRLGPPTGCSVTAQADGEIAEAQAGDSLHHHQ